VERLSLPLEIEDSFKLKTFQLDNIYGAERIRNDLLLR
jgi:hypothetical protein